MRKHASKSGVFEQVARQLAHVSQALVLDPGAWRKLECEETELGFMASSLEWRGCGRGKAEIY
jgi:hypothetical protein